MKRWAPLIAVLALSAAVWLALGALTWPARAYTTFLLVPLPALGLAQARALVALAATHGPLPRLPVYISSGVTLWLLAILAIIAASASAFTAGLLGLRPIDLRLFLAWTVFAVACALMLYAFGRYWSLRESPFLMQLLPHTWIERVVFVGLSMTAGICEEVVFRGFLIAALTVPIQSLLLPAGVTATMPSALLAAAVSSISFGVLHAYQGRMGAARATVLGFALAIPYVLSGSLLPSMVAHTLIDIIGGFWLAREPEGAQGLQCLQ